MDELSLREFVRKFGKVKAERFLSELGKLQGFADAVNSEMGRELLAGWWRDWSVLFEKIVRREATDDEKLTFAVIDHQLMEAAKKIENYLQHKSGIEEAMRE